MTIIDQFGKHARAASFHYADDTGQEWGLAKTQEAAALELFDDNPDLQADMRVICERQLWSLDRPVK